MNMEVPPMVFTDEYAVERLQRELKALTMVAKTLTAPLELSELLDAIMKKIIGVLEPADAGIVMLWDNSAGLFRPAAAFGYDQEILKQMGLRAGESITGKVYDSGMAHLISKPEEIKNAMADMRPANRRIMVQAFGSEELPHCTIASPISADDTRFGVLILQTITSPVDFTETDQHFVQILADLMALAIERTRLEASADAVRVARRFDRLQSEAMATLSHQLRMPLTIIQGYTSALLLGEISWSMEKQMEFLQMIEQECVAMQIMIKELLDTSLIEDQQISVKPELVRLERLAREVIMEIQMGTSIHQLLSDFSPNFPVVEADPHWIKQVFRNILDNAVKYSPDGGLIVIKGEARPKDIVISIADQGIGISSEDLIPLFEKYFRVRSTSTLHISGTGLGLPIARAIVEAHHGRIWAESKLDQGTIFSFSLPRPDHDVVESETVL
jgi:K+-sensing histidine kinase KdpD